MTWRARLKSVAIVILSTTLPVAALVVFVGAPTSELGAVIMGMLAAIGLCVISLVEGIIGLTFRNRMMAADGGLRIVVILLLATPPIGRPIIAMVPLAWSFVQTFDPAYACRDATCEDAIVASDGFGGEMLTPRCYVELVRLADPRGGRAAAVGVLRRLWTSNGPADIEAFTPSSSISSRSGEASTVQSAVRIGIDHPEMSLITVCRGGFAGSACSFAASTQQNTTTTGRISLAPWSSARCEPILAAGDGADDHHGGDAPRDRAGRKETREGADVARRVRKLGHRVGLDEMATVQRDEGDHHEHARAAWPSLFVNRGLPCSRKFWQGWSP